MPDLQTIWDEDVAPVIQDDSFSLSVDGVRLFNRCIDEVSGLVLLPYLETIGTVETVAGANHVPMPTGYQRNLRLCRSQEHNRFIKIYGSVALLFREYRVVDMAGPVIGVSVKGSDLYYQRIPSTPEILDVHYWSSPEAYDESDIPSAIPAHLQRGLLAGYANWKIWALKEDGIDGQKINAEYYRSEFATAFASLMSFIGPEHNSPIDIYDESRLDCFL